MEVLEERKIYLEGTKKSEDTGIRYPLYTNCYANALEAMWSNIQYNKNAKAQGAPQGLVSNIIAFMGVRGSGKTTALNEFNRILGKHDEYIAKHGKVLLPNRQNQDQKCTGGFHVLKSIDASLLEKDEDIIELIWANMFKDFEHTLKGSSNCREYREYRENRDEATRSIVDQFDKVYKSYQQSKEKQVMLGDTVLAKLKNLASSLKTKEFCDELIEKFLKYMHYRADGQDTNFFLVVTVDDLDLNLESGYRILENLYRYLNNPYVVVLIAVDHLQIKMISNRHFIENFYVKGKKDEPLYARHAEQLSGDFLVKVLPLSNRVYMPDYRNILNKAIIVGADRSNFLKQFILGKIAEKMGIYYDAVGLKWHFSVPKTLREIVQYNDFLESLYDISDVECGTEEIIRRYEANHERFNRNISENMGSRILNLQQQELFDKILGRNIERRAEYAVNFLNNERKITAQGENQQKLSDYVDDQNYCYSDLLEAIYSSGREDYDQKVLIHCVLASFTSEITKEYYNYANNPNEAAQNEAARRLESFLGNTVGGNWLNKMGFGVVADKDTNRSDTSNKTFMVQWVDKGDICQFHYSRRLEIGEGGERDQLDVLSFIIPMLECVFALFPNYYDKDGNKAEPVWAIEIIGEEGKTCSINVEVDNKSADFDIWGFVGKEIVTEDKSKLQRQTEKIVESLLNGFIAYHKKKGKRITEKKKETYRKQLLEKSIWDQSKKRKIYFPFYNLDLTYNVIKRVKRKMVMETIDKSEILTYLQRVYGHIAYELAREDQFYKEADNSIEESHGNTGKSIASSFKEDFVSHPFIKAIGYRYWDKETKETITVEEKINKNDFNELLYLIFKEFHTANEMDKYAVADME
ncbi:MAG: hypothetical protein OSJ71_08505 [Acetatifactor sp.]|nr:hypothetical protein [Acetatifactor sp.]